MSSLEDRTKLAADLLNSVLKRNAPKDTWNLTRNGIWIVQEAGCYYVIIGGEPAPYAYATNEKWLSGQWNNKQNPNEGWIDKSIKEAIPLIKNAMTGTLDENDIKKYVQNNEEQLRRRQMAVIKQKLEQRSKL